MPMTKADDHSPLLFLVVVVAAAVLSDKTTALPLLLLSKQIDLMVRGMPRFHNNMHISYSM
jgi:hypothetical protein